MKTSIEAPVAIVGAGISGVAARELLRALGVPDTSMVIFDDVPSKGAYNDPESLMKEFRPKTLVVSPGVPLSTPWIQTFKAGGGHVTSELELALQTLKGERIVGVTGAVGKSTTVSLLGAALKSFHNEGFVGGNLGVPLAAYASEVLFGKRKRAEWVVLEFSSFHLEACDGLKCAGSALSALTRNHLERYVSLDHYYETKWTLAKHTRGPVVINENGGDLADFARRQAPLVDGGHLVFASRDSKALTPEQYAKAKLMGAHNRDNLAVAATLARQLGWPETSIDAMLDFEGLAHRLEPVGTFGGVRFVNDSKATAMESVLTAVSSLKEDTKGRLWVLLGGKDKKLPWEKLAPLGADKSLRFVFFGACGELAQKDSKLAGARFAGLQEAVSSLKGQVASGDLVLLSPGGTSLDEFKGFEDRGRHFAEWVKAEFAL